MSRNLNHTVLHGKHRIEVEADCYSCKGTGLYKGMAERESVAVQCHTCNGSGMKKQVFTWTDFNGRKKRNDIKMVLWFNPGYVVADSNAKEFAAIPVEEWEKNNGFVKGQENRNKTCPAWWYQNVNDYKKPNWKECGFGRFFDCEHFPCKSKCWERFDKENTNE